MSQVNKAFEAGEGGEWKNGSEKVRGVSARKIDDEVSLETKIAIRQMRGRSASVTEDDERITFSWENVTVQAELPGGGSRFKKCCGRTEETTRKVKTIIKNASGYVKSGELVALMGASGAGKTTLLNALTYNNLKGLEVVSGARYANGVAVTSNSLTAVSGYVQQDDLFIGTLTVRETLIFQAMVRMDPNIPKKQRMERVKSVIDELGLSRCADTLIGIAGRVKGISGGESKLLAFACEVLTNPPLLFCDEPTSGLDSYMAQNVVMVLKSLAAAGKTILCTIHQPNSIVFDLFDRVLLMAEGRLAYLGYTQEANAFFSKVGFPCPDDFNPADHYVNVLAVVPGQEEERRARVASICDAFKESPQGRLVEAEVKYEKDRANSSLGMIAQAGKKKISPYKASWWEQFRALLWRSWLSTIKEPMLIQVRFFQAILLGVVLGTLYFGQEYTQEGVQNINGGIFLILSSLTFSTANGVINVFCTELPILLREHFKGMYRVDAYFITRQLAELPPFMISPLIFLSIFYFMMGLNPEIERFLVACGVVLLMVQVVMSFGYFISCAAGNLPVALEVMTPLLIPLMLFGGLFISIESLPSFLVWAQWLSWYRYAYEILVVNQWDGVDSIECPAGEDLLAPVPAHFSYGLTYNYTGDPAPCTYPDGDSVIRLSGFDKDAVIFNVAMLFVMVLVLRVMAFLALFARSRRN